VDLPLAPEDTSLLLDALRSGADIVVVERRNREAYGVIRKLISWSNVALVRLLLRSPFLDHNFVQAYRRSALERLPVESAGVSTVTAELISKGVAAGYKVVSVPATYHARRAGRSSVTVRRIVRSILELLRLRAILRRWKARGLADAKRKHGSEPEARARAPRDPASCGSSS